MAFKQNPNKKARLEDLSKAALIKTVRTLQRRETKLLNQVAKLEGGQANRLLDNLRPAVEFGYRAGEKGVDNVEMTLHKWVTPARHNVAVRNSIAAAARDEAAHLPDPLSGVALDEAFERIAAATPHKFPWET